MTKFHSLLAQFTATLNVKLRYEQIIKNILENDKKNEKDRRTIKVVIENTKTSASVLLSKEGDT